MRALFIIGVLVTLLTATLFTFTDVQLTHIGEWLVYACLPACNGFVLVYLFRPWFRSQIGRALMTKAAAVAALFDMTAVAQVFRFQLSLEVQVFVVGALVIGIWYQFLVLCSTPRDRGFRRPTEGEQSEEVRQVH